MSLTFTTKGGRDVFLALATRALLAAGVNDSFIVFYKKEHLAVKVSIAKCSLPMGISIGCQQV